MRPVTFDTFIGQQKVKKQINTAIDAIRRKRSHLDHIMLSGPAGLGKTTIAKIVANMLGTRCIESLASVLKKPEDLVVSLIHLKDNDIFFIDEIHTLPLKVQEYLYTAMEDYEISMMSGPKTKHPIKIRLNKFVLIGATTIEGLISRPMLDRFGISCRLQPYDVSEMVSIINSSLAKEGWRSEDGAVLKIAERCRSVPRIALKFIKRIKDLCESNIITNDAVRETFDMLGITDYGLTEDDMKVLIALHESEKPMGLQTLAAVSNISKHTLESVVEPHLMRCGFMIRLSRGRQITITGHHVAALNV